MAGKAGLAPPNPHAARDPQTVGHFLNGFVSRGLKIERLPTDNDDNCCFDVQNGDHITVLNGNFPAVVNECWFSGGLFQFSYVRLNNGERCEGKCYYDEFNKTWRFGWDFSTRSKYRAAKELYDFTCKDAVLRHYVKEFQM